MADGGAASPWSSDAGAGFPGAALRPVPPDEDPLRETRVHDWWWSNCRPSSGGSFGTRGRPSWAGYQCVPHVPAGPGRTNIGRQRRVTCRDTWSAELKTDRVETAPAPVAALASADLRAGAQGRGSGQAPAPFRGPCAWVAGRLRPHHGMAQRHAGDTFVFLVLLQWVGDDHRRTLAQARGSMDARVFLARSVNPRRFPVRCLSGGLLRPVCSSAGPAAGRERPPTRTSLMWGRPLHPRRPGNALPSEAVIEPPWGPPSLGPAPALATLTHLSPFEALESRAVRCLGVKDKVWAGRGMTPGHGRTPP